MPTNLIRSVKTKRATRAQQGDASERQEGLLSFLLTPRSYPHRPKRVRLVQTHSSFVFIVPPFVYKVKKPVNFGFLDFSTLEKRRYFCQREVELNRRLCQNVYLGVIPISRRGKESRRTAGELEFGEGGKVVEYAVQMRKLSDGHFLDQLVERQEVGPGDMDRIAMVLKHFYEAQQPTKEIEAWGRIDRLRISTDENFSQTEAFHTISGAAFEAIRCYTNRFYSRHARLFASRVQHGWIRDCHGDLHLEHIHLTARALQIYDCIEFNDRFRYVDVSSDAAFLAMDLDYEGRSDLARYFATRLAKVLEDEGMPRLMDFYKCYRTYVRGKVESLHSVANTAPEQERQASADRARRYFKLALQYAVAGSNPLVLVVMGRIASGKSTLSQGLGAELGWNVFSSDAERKKMAGLPVHRRSSGAARARLYSRAMTERTYQRLLKAADGELREGRSVILDATFARRAQRALLAEHFGKRGIIWVLLEAQASDAAVKQRLREREGKPKEISDARMEDFDRLSRRYQPPVELAAGQWVKVRTVGGAERAVTKGLEGLARLQVERSGG